MNHQNIIILLIFIQEIITSYIYLGVERYGSINRTEVLNPESKIYRFLKEDKEEQIFKIYPGDIIDINETGPNYDTYKCEDGAYPIQNRLIEGYEYNLTIDNDCIKEIKQITKKNSDYKSPIKYTAGLKTLKNFIAAAFQPVGTTLYVFGGGWDFQDVGTSNDGRTIGISENWVLFFEEQNTNYTYRDDNNKDKTYYPFGSFNEYYYAGLDCSGFVGWTIYNNIYNESLHDGFEGFVVEATKMAKNMKDKNYGEWMHTVEGSTFTNPNYTLLTEELKVGDILSTKGHVMIVLGKCKDGSFIILHSTPSKSKTNYPGGGVQISAVNPKDSGNKTCEAYELCQKYMKKYFKKWSDRYEPIVTSTETVFNFDDEAPDTGIFHWNIENGPVTDPDNYRDKFAEEILKDLFEEFSVKKKGLIIAYVTLMGIIVISLSVVIVIALKNSLGNKDDNNKKENLIETE